MKIKILKNVISQGAILKRDAVHDLPDEHAQVLLKGKHARSATAEEAKGAESTGESQQRGGTQEILLKKNVTELTAIIIDLNKDRAADKKITFSTNPSKEELVKLIMAATGYTWQD